MRATLRLTLVATLAALAVTAPTSSHALSKRSFRVSDNGRGKLDPFHEISKTSRKYGLSRYWQEVIIPGAVGVTSSSLELPSPISTGTSAPSLAPTSPATYTNNPTAAPSPTESTEDGQVTATPEENESEYLSPVTVGGQRLNLNFDTGSADLWVFSTELSKSEIGSHAAFDPSKSSNWQTLEGSTWKISYGDNSAAKGVVGYDTVDVGGSTVHKQCVEIATAVSEQFVEDVNSDGLLGLAFSNINTVLPVHQKTFFENVMPHLSQPLFTADLEETDGTGTYEFGTIDKSKFKGDIHYTAVDKSKGYWKIDTPVFQIDGKKQSCDNCWAFADTGTSLLYLNRDVVADYYAKVPSASYGYPGGYLFDCSEKLPDMSVMIGEYAATIKGSDLTYTEVFEGTCFGGLQSLDSPCNGNNCPATSSMQILGDVFLKQFFVVFDGGNLQLGIAEKN